MSKINKLVFVGLSSVLGASPSIAQSVAGDRAAGLESVVVTGEHLPYVVNVPGSTAVVSAADLENGRISNVEDALKFVPGVFAQSASGGEGTRLSIRGSGISKGGFTWGNGVQILFDGLSLSSPFGTPYESFEPNAYNSIEVYKGANAFEYGATQLGGVINFVQHTGYDASPLLLRAEGGTDGYNRQQISSGQVIGALDYYVSATRFMTDGFQRNAAASSDRFIGNVGYQITPALKTRFYLEFADQYQQNINALTLAQLQSDPRQNPGSPNGSRTNHGSTFVANKTTYDIDSASNLEFGFQYKYAPLHNGNLPIRTYWHASDWAASLKYRRNDVLFGGHESNTTIAFLPSAAIPGSHATVTNDTTGQLLGNIKYAGSNTTLLVSNDFALQPDLWLLTGIAGVWQTRSNNITNPVAAGVDPKLNKSYANVTPRVGLRYEATPQIQVYGNISRLIEAPQIISYSASANGVYTGYSTTTAGNVFDTRSLTVQSGMSYEAGIKGGTGRFKWDLAYYNEQLKNELLTVFAVLPSPAVPNGVSFTENAPPTVHEGIEAFLDAALWEGGGHRISLRQSYTWSSFRFVHKAPLQDILPGLPEHSYQAELNYTHASGFYASAGVEAILTQYPVDYANSAFAPSYALFNLAVGFANPDPDAKWRIFLESRNLTDERYASFTSTTGVASASSAIYTPGQGRTVTAGIAYAL